MVLLFIRKRHPAFPSISSSPLLYPIPSSSHHASSSRTRLHQLLPSTGADSEEHQNQTESPERGVRSHHLLHHRLTYVLYSTVLGLGVDKGGTRFFALSLGFRCIFWNSFLWLGGIGGSVKRLLVNTSPEVENDISDCGCLYV